MSPKAQNEREKNARGPPWRSVFCSLFFRALYLQGGCSTYRIWAQGELTIFTSTSAAAIGNLDGAKEETRAAGSE